jgi:predicted transcriptional regulator
VTVLARLLLVLGQGIDKTYRFDELYVMQTKLTLRVDDSVIRKAKRIARKRGTSVSRIFSDYISEAEDDPQLDDLGEITASMIGALRGVEIEEVRKVYRSHLEKKHL